MIAAEAPVATTGGRSAVEVSISMRTILLVAGAVAISLALASIASVLLTIFVSIFGVAVLSPVASFMERRLRWSRALCSTVLVIGTLLVLGVIVLILAEAVSSAVRGFGHDLPQIIDKVRHSDLGGFINNGSNSLDTLKQHSGEIVSGAGNSSLARKPNITELLRCL